jgi:hypothetical protein
MSREDGLDIPIHQGNLPYMVDTKEARVELSAGERMVRRESVSERERCGEVRI